jgi:putative hydroxymethylpyrimidine transport system substrate-binding protein
VSGDPAQALAKHKVDVLLGMYLDDPRLPSKKASVATIDGFGIPTYNELVLVADQDALGRDGDVFRSVNGALSRATADLRQGRADAIASVPGGKSALQAVLSRLGPQQTPGAWKAFAEWMRANGLLKTEPNAAAALTNKYLPGQAP